MKSVLWGATTGLFLGAAYIGYEFLKVRRAVIAQHGMSHWRTWRP